MERSSPAPLALRLAKQGHEDVLSQMCSPSRRTSGSSYPPSEASTPASVTSVCSTMRLTNYGADMNRDFEVITLLEDRLGREVEHEELRAAIANFALVHGVLPSVRQLALELVAGEGRSSSGGSSGGKQSTSVALTPDKPIYFGPARALYTSESPGVGLSEGLHGGDESSPAPFLTSPSLSPSAPEASLDANGWGASGTPETGARRELTWAGLPMPSDVVLSNSVLGATSDPGAQPVTDGQAGEDAEASGDDATGDEGRQLPTLKPFIPGLNLRGIKKRSPLSRGAGAGLALAETAGGGAGPNTGAANPGASAGPAPGGPQAGPDTFRGSPTEMLRLLLPSACKPRNNSSHNGAPQHHSFTAGGASYHNSGAGAGVGAGGRDGAGSFSSLGGLQPMPLRDWGDSDRTHPPRGPQQAGQLPTGVVAEWAAAAAVATGVGPAGGEAVPGGERCQGLEQAMAQVPPVSPRLSMDHLDQSASGPRRHTPTKTAGKASDTALPGELWRGSAAAAVGGGGAGPVPRLRPLGDPSPAAHPAQAEGPSGKPSAGAGGKAVVEAGDEAGGESPADCALRRDTPSKATGARPGLGLNLGAITPSRIAVPHPDLSPTPKPTPSRSPAHSPSPVPPLRLPTNLTSSGSFPAARPSTRRHGPPRAGGASLALSLSLAAAQAGGTGAGNVPPLPLALAAAAASAGAHLRSSGVPSGARTRRLSICLPSALVYGEGPLTTRRLVATATRGVTSHALCTVFWAESEDELEEYDSEEDLHGSDYDEAALYGNEYGLGDPAAVASSAATLEAAEAASLVFTAAAAAAASSVDAGQHSTQAPLRAGGGRRGMRVRRRARHGRDQPDAEADGERCGGGLVLPEELWDAWERLSDGPKGRQYRLLESLTHVERLSCTSYSTVSKASHEGKPVVVKIYDVAERDKLANAFAEIGVLLHLAGWPGAVRLLDYGRHEDKVMLMLESCDHSLKDWCDSQRFDVATGPEYILDCLKLWCTLAELMAELHERWHVAHCDLKPGNVLLSGGRLRLADFGESMLFNGTPLLLDQARGTVPYQPPEMVAGHCVDARKADVWALGCILYEMITGELLFKGNNDCLRAVAGASSGNGGGASGRSRQKRRSRGTAGGGSFSGGGGEGGAGSNGGGPASSGGGADASGAEAAAAAAAELGHVPMAPPPPPPGAVPPRVPRLPLGLARLPGMQPPANQPQLQPPQPLQPTFLLGGLTGRSLELIAEGCGTETCSTAANSSRAPTESWAGPSAANTARSTATAGGGGGYGGGAPYDTARSSVQPYDTARSAPYGNAPYDTARSAASGSTAAGGAGGGGWPPPPPPSAGTARSVADSEWSLAPVPSFQALAVGAAAAMPPPPLPAYRRLRHSVGTQCTDTAGPDWLSTEEADRLRIMADEPPSFVTPPPAAPASAPVSNRSCSGRSGAGCEAGVRVGVDEASGGGAGAGGVEEALAYKPRLLSGADGPSLCDDVLRLLGCLLVEDTARPSMRRVAALAAEVLARHLPPDEAPPAGLSAIGQPWATPGPSLPPPAPAPTATQTLGAARPAEAPLDVPQVPRAVLRPPALQLQLQPSFEAEEELAAEAEAAAQALAGLELAEAAAPAVTANARPVSLTQLVGLETRDQQPVSSSHQRLFLPPLPPQPAAAAPGAGVGLGGARAMSLFEFCQPLLTTRGARPMSRSWQRFLAQPQNQS
ncbi:hypothetical protein HYH03_014290 [Edaphochlamys debaryana]|uniref:Protein kinase domain-containing protein n=1 Tax=Edaphochlamys debaryana TaxID=47281 RepID=A0A836BTP1_9CHLO|nr:hypothetical protein HYH03_014290 [Edaphochlamys debaryana]|eukprot:KAG2487044.1 hypothetical protein HYH03_014290 [Edaphochlamys debaryana]